MPGVVEITEENLEDLLAYDDLFLDYFNAFLSLPVFSQPLHYNRLTGTFEEVEGSVHPLGARLSLPETPPYGATDEERERMLEWAREQRLPFFLRTHLFREFKLCKLLLRALEEVHPPGSRRGSRYTVRGYSRQTGSYVSSLSNSGDNSATDVTDDEGGLWGPGFRRSALYRYQRPGSNAYSLPSRLGLFRVPSRSADAATVDTRSQETALRYPQSAGSKTRSGEDLQSVHSKIDPTVAEGSLQRDVTFTLPDAENNHTEEISKKSSTESYQRRTRSGRSRKSARSKDDSAERPRSVLEDLDAALGEEVVDAEALLTFNDDVISDTQTEHDVRNLEGRHKMSLQQIKEQIIGSVSGIDEFKNFLSNTVGRHLFNFWMDCEMFKDTMEDYDDNSFLAYRNRLFRDIQDKHRMNLTDEAKKQLLKASSHSTLGHTIFIRTQYDVLRRLRAYWVPRFLIHKERMDQLSAELKPPEVSGGLVPEPMVDKVQPARGLVFFPSISLVNSMPAVPERALQMTHTSGWDTVSKGGRRLDDRIKSAKCLVRDQPHHEKLQERLILALMADKSAGGPYQSFLERHQDPGMLSNLLFWQDVTEYGAAEDRSADRLLRLHRAWDIFNTYLCVGSRHAIGIDGMERDRIHKILLTSEDFISCREFDKAKGHAVQLLERSWVRYLKEDMKKFIESHDRDREFLPSTAEEIEVTFDGDERLVVRRNRPWVRRKMEHHQRDDADGYPPSTASERGRRLRTALSLAESIDEVRLAEQRRRRKEQRREMERERRKAIRAAKRRQKEMKGKSVSFRQEEVEEELTEEESPPPEEQEEPAPEFAASVQNNKGLVGLFKRYLSENEGKGSINMLNLYMDVDAYTHINKDKNEKQKKEVQANFIARTYLEQGARKKVLMSDKVYDKMKREKERPKSATLKECQHHLLPTLEELFKTFWETQAEELGIDSKMLAQMSKAQLAMQGDDPSLLSSWKRKGKGKPDGRAQPTREDKMELLVALSNAAGGHLPLRMLYFYKYLVKHGEEDGCPLIDNDLFFYCEVQKFRDAHHAHSNEELLRRKVQSIVECYLESSSPPALQIDIPSDMQQKTLRAAQRYLAGKDPSPSLLDEAQYQVFKELLPYWAGFVKNFKPPEDETKKPCKQKDRNKSPILTRKQRERRDRLESILSFKPPTPKQHSLPPIPKNSNVAAFSFSLNNGVAWKDGVERTGLTPDQTSLGGNPPATASVVSFSLGPPHKPPLSRRGSLLSTGKTT